MAEIFDCSTDNVSLHLKNIFKENQLDSNSVTKKFSEAASNGKKYKIKFCNLDSISLLDIEKNYINNSNI